MAQVMPGPRRLSGSLALGLAWSVHGAALATGPGATTRDANEVGPPVDAADSDASVPVIARAGLEIDTAEAGAAGPVLLSRLEELGNLELRRAEILPRRAGDDPVIHVRIAQRGKAGDTYAIASEVTVRGATVEDSLREVVCTLCTEGEAVERARSELLRLVPFVRARFRPTTRDEAKLAAAPGPASTEMGKAGVGLLVGGSLAFGTGLGLALAKPRPDPDDPLREIDTHPAGYAVLAVGATAIVSGAVLLILDRRPSRRTARLAPLLHPAMTGLQLVGRF